MANFGSFDRRVGRRVRGSIEAIPGGAAASRAASEALAPAFEALVASLLVRSHARRTGFEALVAGAGASLAARAARDAIARPRPGPRLDGGFPSRHAAAAVAIAGAVTRRHPGLRPWVAGAAAAGLVGRVATGEHDPGDILAGAVLGWCVDRLVARSTR
jgi:membrane-associated phospholipid phosphatase